MISVKLNRRQREEDNKRLYVTDVTGLLFAGFVVIFNQPGCVVVLQRDLLQGR